MKGCTLAPPLTHRLYTLIHTQTRIAQCIQFIVRNDVLNEKHGRKWHFVRVITAKSIITTLMQILEHMKIKMVKMLGPRIQETTMSLENP